MRFASNCYLSANAGLEGCYQDARNEDSLRGNIELSIKRLIGRIPNYEFLGEKGDWNFVQKPSS